MFCIVHPSVVTVVTHFSSLFLFLLANKHQSVKTQQPYLDLLLKQPLENKKMKVTALITSVFLFKIQLIS